MRSKEEPKEVKVRVAEGSRMRAYQNNMYVMEFTASAQQMPLMVELLQSEQYDVASPNPIIIKGFDSGPRRGIFIIKPNDVGKVALNFRVGDKVKTHFVSSQTENPYVFGEPIKDEHLFFGRVAEISEVYRGITKRNKQNFLITGPRRAGKTSLLLQLKARLQPPFFALMLTPEKTGHQHFEMFRSILLALRDEVREGLDADPPPLGWDIKSATAETPIDLFNFYFERDLKKLLDWLAHLSEEARFILLLDEANFLVSQSSSGPTAIDSRQEFLRHLLQSHERLACVLAGTPQIVRMTGVTSPLYNIFSGIKLRGLSVEETQRLVREPARQVGLEFDDDAVAEIIEFGGCSPYYTQALCSLSVDLMYESTPGLPESTEILTVTSFHVEAATRKVLDTVGYGLRSLWEALEPDEQILLRQMASSPVIVTRENRESITRLADMNIISEIVRDQGTPAQKTYASIKARLDEEWIQTLEAV